MVKPYTAAPWCSMAGAETKLHGVCSKFEWRSFELGFSSESMLSDVNRFTLLARMKTSGYIWKHQITHQCTKHLKQLTALYNVLHSWWSRLCLQHLLWHVKLRLLLFSWFVQHTFNQENFQEPGKFQSQHLRRASDGITLHKVANLRSGSKPRSAHMFLQDTMFLFRTPFEEVSRNFVALDLWTFLLKKFHKTAES